METVTARSNEKAAPYGIEVQDEAPAGRPLKLQIPMPEEVGRAIRAGDKVHAGQVLMRIDARAAEQTAAAGLAQAPEGRQIFSSSEAGAHSTARSACSGNSSSSTTGSRPPHPCIR